MSEAVRQDVVTTIQRIGSPVGKRWRYPAAVTTAGSSRGLADAVRWVSTATQRIGGTPLLRVPRASTVSTCAALRRFVDAHRVVVSAAGEADPPWRRGAVLAVWPDRGDIAELADDPRTTALCVAPVQTDDIGAWAAIARPELLAQAIAPVAPGPLEPVVAQALITMSGMLTHPVTLAAPSDYRDATAILDILYRDGRHFTGDAVYTWALTRGWPALGARRLADLATAFTRGKPPFLPSGNPFQRGIIDVWRTRAAEAARLTSVAAR